MAEPTKAELKEAKQIWLKVPKDDAGWRGGFKCGRDHDEQAIGLIAMGLAARPDPYRPPCEVHRDKARSLAEDPDSIKDPAMRNLARAFRLEADARMRAEMELRNFRDEGALVDRLLAAGWWMDNMGRLCNDTPEADDDG